MKREVKAGTVEPTVADEEALADITGEGSELPVAHSGMGEMAKLGEVSGEMSRSDINIPRLNLVQSVGPLSTVYQKGQWVLGKETVVAEKGEDMRVVVLSLTKFFQERLVYDANGPRPALFKNEAEVFAAGLTLEWKDGDEKNAKRIPPTAEPIARALMLLQSTKTADPVFFPLTVGENKWTVVEWMLRRTSYTRAAKTIFRARALELQETGLLSGLWTLKSADALIAGNNVAAPVMQLIGRNTPEDIKRITELCSGTV